MPGKVRFQEDPLFRTNVYRASNKSGSSLRGLYDQVRAKTDDIAKAARANIAKEYEMAQSHSLAAKALLKPNADNRDYLTSKARAFALRSALNTTMPTMGFDGKEIYGRVTMNRKGSMTLEFGGPDPVAEIGFGTNDYVIHPPYGFLRRAADREG